MSAARRFRVALSFPGEHRGRVEKIAEGLERHLGHETVMYDKRYDAELASLDLDVYLTKLYRDQSDLVVCFLCREYGEKEWCRLEWRVARDLLKRKQGRRVMLLRLDDAEIDGLLSIDVALDIRAMSDGEVAAAILKRLSVDDAPRSFRAFTSKLPTVDPTLIGREEQIAFLDRAWADPATNFVQVIAAGGTGKTALMDKWFRRHLGEATVFGWSFYSQGTSENRQTSSDLFFAEILRWFGIEIEASASIYAKAEAVARRLREERVLLILDGVEPLQDPTGALRDLPLKALLQELDTANRGMVLCTTRVRLDIPDDPPRALSRNLDDLTPEDGAEYLRRLKVQGTEEELQAASRAYGNHALALTLLGTYLADFCDGDIWRRLEIRELIVEDVNQGEHARHVMSAYEQVFAGKPEGVILRALGYFDRPAEPEALKLVLPGMEERKYRAALKRLYEARLILTKDPREPIDCHPLVREHFASVMRTTAAKEFREGHRRLFEHYSEGAPHLPDTLEEMTPLFYAVYHGCQAGWQQAAIEEVYRDRIYRGDEFYLLRELGAFGTALSLLANFFESPWTEGAANLSPTYQSWVIANAGFALRAVGRLADATEPMRVSANLYVEAQNWKSAAISFGNLSELLLALGNVRDAIDAARQSVAYADRSWDDYEQLTDRTTLADALHQSGDFAGALRLFTEAERRQAAFQPDYPILYSLWGYRYCDFLLSQGQSAEVVRRASSTILWQEGRLLAFGLDHVSLGRALAPGSAEQTSHLDQAVDFLRRAGALHMLPLGLLARGTLRDLDEVFRIATRSGMRLHLTDYHLASARLALSNGDRDQARTHLDEAAALVKETGYHRRDRDVAELRAKVDA